MPHCLVWVRNDLRLHDNEALTRACRWAAETGGRVGCVYVLDPHWFATTAHGFDRIGPFRRRFLRQSLEDLATSLNAIGGRLDVIRGATDEVLATVASRLDAEVVFCNQEIASEEAAIEYRVRSRLSKHGIEFDVARPNLLLDESDLPFDVDELPEVFSKFRRKVEKHWTVGRALPEVTHVPAGESLGDAVVDPATAAELAADVSVSEPSGLMEFPGGESAGLRRLRDYVFERNRLRVYKETRNGMLHPDDSSKLSPWLAMGCLSPRRVYEIVKQYEDQRIANDSTYWLVFELLWRDYFAWIVAKHRSDVFREGGLRQLELPWKTDWQRFDAWREGRTGFPLIDAGMRELRSTGFLSNRARQNVASFLTKNLGIDWRMGAEWFESLLVDYDPCSNYGNWNYSAGVGNDSRGFRWFNPIKQAERYDPDGEYVRYWIPELANVPDGAVHTPWELTPSQQSEFGCVIGVDYPRPIVDLFQSADHHRELYEQAEREHWPNESLKR
jgi:deoxyribodipyrimidine photo-lyase